jgi:hypothetical protein
MLLGVTGLAVLTAFASAVGGPGAWLILGVFIGSSVLLAGPVCLGTLALYSRGQRQTFFLGAFIGSLAPLFTERDIFLRTIYQWPIMLVTNFAVAFFWGYLAVITRRFAERRGWHLPPRASDVDSSD